MASPRPADPRLDAANIKSGIVAALVARADELGVPCDAWFSGLRLRREQFVGEAPIYLSYRQACLIIQRAVSGLPGEGHGLVLGARQDLAQFGLIGLAMMTAADFGEALRIGVRYAPITGAMLDLALDEGDTDQIAVVLRMRTRDPEIEPYLCEELVSSSLMLCRGLLGDAFRPTCVDLAYPAPGYADDYAAAFDSPVRFDQPRTRVVMDRAWLARPMPAANRETARQIVALCRAQMPSEQAPGELVSGIEQRLQLQVADNPRLADLAAELHLSERTLRRQLRAAGTSFRELHDRVRSETARDLLRERGYSVAAVSAALGFRDPRDFRRAFKRWTGSTPRQVRPRA